MLLKASIHRWMQISDALDYCVPEHYCVMQPMTTGEAGGLHEWPT